MASAPKIKVAILFVGQIRTNSLSNNTNTDDILNSYHEYLFTNEWREKIDHDNEKCLFEFNYKTII